MISYFKFFFILFIFFSKLVHAKEINIIRDAEIENFLNDLTQPILSVSSIKNNKISFYLDKQKYINAFVVNGPKIFITTELLMKANNIHQIAGVIAHEIGHITGGHLDKRIKLQKDSFYTSIISSLLAVGAIAAGAGSASTAIIMGGAHLSQQSALSFSRNQESFADQAAINLIKKTNYSVKGMYELFEILELKERFSKINPYNQTHPLSGDRKKIIEYHINNESKKPSSPELDRRFELIKAKLIGFTSKKEIFKNYYSENDNSLEANYAKSIHSYLNGDIQKSIKYVDKCITIDKTNPYFFELKGQIFYENGKVNDAIINYKKALEISNNEKHFFLALAKATYASGDKENFESAIKLLKKYIKMEDYPVEAWHYLGLFYGRMGNLGLSSLSLAEKFLLLNDLKNARLQLQKAKKYNNSVNNIDLKIKDLLYLINQKEKKMK